jgi:hypothetical protein
VLGIDGGGATPSLVAIASTPPPVTAPPPTDTPAPEATEGPTPTPQLGPPDTLTAAGDKTGFETPLMSFVCPANDGCRDGVKDRIITMLAALQGKASGTRLISFSSTPAGTLPITAEWKNWHYPYSAADGSKGDLTEVSIDLAPHLVGAPSYALVKDVSGAQFTFVIASADADALFRQLYDGAILEPAPTPPPDAGGGVIWLGDIYTRPIGDFLLQDLVFVQP